MGPSKQGQETNCLVAGAWTDAHSLKGQLEPHRLQHLQVCDVLILTGFLHSHPQLVTMSFVIYSDRAGHWSAFMEVTVCRRAAQPIQCCCRLDDKDCALRIASSPREIAAAENEAAALRILKDVAEVPTLVGTAYNKVNNIMYVSKEYIEVEFYHHSKPHPSSYCSRWLGHAVHRLLLPSVCFLGSRWILS